MNVRLISIAIGLLAACATAAVVRSAFSIFGLTEVSLLSDFSALFVSTFVYGFAPAAAAAAIVEIMRLRHAAAHIGFGVLVTIFGSYLAALGEPLTSAAFANGALSGLRIVAVGSLSALVYWSITGRNAGWRGDEAERKESAAAEAFQLAGANAKPQYCFTCLLQRAVLGGALFALFCWGALSLSGLGPWFVAEAEYQGNESLKKSGFVWAKFKVEGDRGVVVGDAPDEAQRLAAYTGVREALATVTGFPGIVSQIDNQTVVRPLAAAQAETAKSEDLAGVAADIQTIAGDAAKAAEAEASRAAEQAAAEPVAAVADQAAPEPVLPADNADDGEVGAGAAALAPVSPAMEQAVAAIDAQQDPTFEAAESPATAPSAEDVGAVPAPVDAAASECTPQDLAMIESTRIHFASQRFDVEEIYDTELNRLAAAVLACSDKFVIVHGYADSRRDSLFNRALPLQRAEALRDRLIERGVPSTRISAKSAGPLAGNYEAIEAAGLSGNQKAEFKLATADQMGRDANLGPDERADRCESDLAEIMTQSVIHFPTSSATISDDSLTLIKKLARSIQACGSVIVTVEGHTDKTGDPIYNQNLSESRASTVRQALIDAGADITRLASRGFSSSQPYDPANNSQAFALNRRIEFKVSGKFTSTGGP